MPYLVLGDKRIKYNVVEWTNRDGMDVQKATGMRWAAWVDAVNGDDRDLLAETALVWIVRRKNGEPDLRFSDVEFSFDSMQIELDEEQLEALEKFRQDLEAAQEAGNPTRPEDETDSTSPSPPTSPTDGAKGSSSSTRPTGSRRSKSSDSSPQT